MTAEASPSAMPSGGGQFPQTLWSVVLRAGQSSGPGADEALTLLCQAYWYPLYSYIRRQGAFPHDAQDLTQAFFVHLLEGQRLGRVSPEKGRFRSFLLAALRNFLADQRDKAAAQKRGGGLEILSLEAQQAEARFNQEPLDPRDPEKLYERQWAMTVLERVLGRLEAEYKDAGKHARFTELEPYLLGEDDAADYASVAKRLGLSIGAVKMAVLRLRQRSRELFRHEIADTVAATEEVEDEFLRLTAALQG